MTQNPWDFLQDYKNDFFSGEWPTLPEMFSITTKRFPDRPCFTAYDPDRTSLTYTEAYKKIQDIAIFLCESGVVAGDMIALTGKNTPEWAIAYMAILFSGAVVVPLDAQLKLEEAENLIKAADVKIVFADEEKFDLIDSSKLKLTAKYSIDKSKNTYIYNLHAKNQEKPILQKSNENDLAVILFTSGTMGSPKGVMLTHKNLVSDCYQAQSKLTLTSNDVFYALLPIHHSYTMLAVFIEGMSCGAEIVFGKRMATKAILKDLKEAKVTMFLGVPVLFNKVLAGIMKGIREKGVVIYAVIKLLMLISGFVKKVFKVNPGKRLFKTVLEKASLYSIRICICGGGPLASSVFKQYNQLGIDFIQGYGLTETSPIVTLNPVNRYKEESVGQIIAGVEMKIINPDNRGIGEVAIKGSMVMKGYYKMPNETKVMFTEDGWLKTGDLGYLDSENYLYLAGRAKNLIVTDGGKNIYPEEIENRFQLFTEVEQVLIRGYLIDVKMKSEGIEAVIYPSEDYFTKDGAVLSKEEITCHMEKIVAKINAEMPLYEKITKITILSEPMEMTTTRKVKRHKVEK